MTLAPKVASYSLSMFELSDLYDEIERCIVNARVDNRANGRIETGLGNELRLLMKELSKKLRSIINSSAYSEILQEAVISIRNGRYVVPVKKRNTGAILTGIYLILQRAVQRYLLNLRG